MTRGANTWIGTTDNFALTFMTNGVGNRMYISNAGNVGIGTSIPSEKLTVAAPSGTACYVSAYSGTTSIFTGVNAAAMPIIYVGSADPIAFFTNATERLRITSGGQLLIGSSSTTIRADAHLQVWNCGVLRSNDNYNGNPSAVIYSAVDTSGGLLVEFTSSSGGRIGSITRNGASNVSYNTSSDRRIKKNIIDAPISLNRLNSIQVRSFDWLEDDAHQDFGFIAQELINVMPIAVTRGAKEKDIWQVDNSKLVPLLVKAIQELKAENTSLINRIEALENK
jgi:hypothetical protein